MFLKGFGLGGFRSFHEPQLFWPLAKINLLIGQNNTGKSNVLHFIARALKPALAATQGSSFSIALDDYLDRPHASNSRDVTFLVARSPALGLDEAITKRLGDQRGIDIGHRILKSAPFTRQTSMAWFEYRGSQNNRMELVKPNYEAFAAGSPVSQNEWGFLWQRLTGGHGGGVEHWIPDILRVLSPVNDGLPEVVLIPAIRAISKGSPAAGHWSGLGLIDELAKIQNPLPKDYKNRERFNRLNEFLQEVTAAPEAYLEIPHDRGEINVHMNGKVLPLASLGTGIQEVIILGAASTVHEGKIICLEEPEIHLHPTLQRKLLKYLTEKTTNQYFVATHSAHLIDSPGASVFRVRLENGYSKVTNAKTANEKWEICSDLGYQASDLMQANCVIWVEGPTDRLYLRHWIGSMADGLIEGIHYSVMFYGGRLLSHLSANDNEVSDFISLRRLNRRGAILIDSDRKTAATPLNATKERVISEFDTGPGFAWVSAGREIENYWSASSIFAAIKQLDDSAVSLQSHTRYSNIWRYKTADDVKEADKVKLAHKLINEPANLDVLDLRDQMKRLVAFIRESNP